MFDRPYHLLFVTVHLFHLFPSSRFMVIFQVAILSHFTWCWKKKFTYMSGWVSCYLCVRCLVWLPRMSTQLPAFRHTHTNAHFRENSWFHSSVPTTFYTRCCNDSKSLIGSECTKDCSCHYSRKSRGKRSGDRAGRLTGPLRPIHCRPKGRLKCCLATRGRLKTLLYSEPTNDIELNR